MKQCMVNFLPLSLKYRQSNKDPFLTLFWLLNLSKLFQNFLL